MARSTIVRAGNWHSFAGSCILIGALLLRVGAPIPAVLAGMLLAGLWNWKGPRLFR